VITRFPLTNEQNMTRTGTAFTPSQVFIVACLVAPARLAHAGSFTASVFATGTSVSASQPDSITLVGDHVFIEYSNGASSTGTGGASTIAEYDMSGKVLNTYSVLGNADGVRHDADTKRLWVLQNQDSNPALTIIDPTTSAATHYTYTSQTPGRGYDDVAFIAGKAYLSYTNPTGGSDPVIVQATLNTANHTVSVSTVLAFNASGLNTATGKFGQIIVNDPDSLMLTPKGSLLLTSEADGTLTTVKNPGSAGQSVSFVQLVDSSKNNLSSLDDTVFPSSTNQRLLVADTANNTVYAVSGPFQLGGAYATIGSTNSVDYVNLTTGVSTPISNGLFLANASPHGLAFIPTVVPEPSALVMSTISALTGLGCYWFRKNRSGIL
jgi:hypothetical protein